MRAAPYVGAMHRRSCLLVVLLVSGCARGSVGPSQYVASISSSTQAADEGDGEEGSAESEAEAEDTAEGESSGLPDDGAPASSEDGDPAESSGVPAESSEGGSSDDGGFASSEDDGAPLPDVSEWEPCSDDNCEAGSDCVGVDGLRSFETYCAPQCEVADDCTPPPDGDAVPVCAISAGGAPSPTHCALVCEVDGDPFGECPAGMFCIDVPGQMTPVSICMWP